MKVMDRMLEDIWINVVNLIVNDDDFESKQPKLDYIRKQLENLDEDIDWLIH